MARKLLTNARVVTPSEVFLGTVEFHAGRIVRVDIGATSLPGAEDLGGDLLLPGLVDLAPAAGLARDALAAADAYAASCGITTAVDALPFVPVEGGGTDGAVFADWLVAARGDARLRCDRWIRWHAAAGTSLPRGWQARLARPQSRLVSASVSDLPTLEALVAEGNRTGLPCVVGDARSAGDANAAIGSGARLFLAPGRGATTAVRRQAAGCVHAVAPLTAADRIALTRPLSRAIARRTALDALASGGAFHALLCAPFRLRDRDGASLADAVTTVTLRPARLAGFTDRGALLLGHRADFIRVREVDGVVHPLATWRGGERVA